MSKVSCIAVGKRRKLLSASGTCLATTEAKRRTLRMAWAELLLKKPARHNKIEENHKYSILLTDTS